MRKIRGFRLTLRPHEVRRRAKKAGLDLEAAGLPEPALARLLESASRAFSPGVLFDTFAHPDPDAALLSPLPGLAYSLVLAVLEDPAPPAPAGAPEGLGPVLREAALDEAVRFACGILADEAEKDACELSPLTELSREDALAAALRKLGGDRLGLRLEEGRLAPAAARAASVSWLSKSKTKGRR